MNKTQIIRLLEKAYRHLNNMDLEGNPFAAGTNLQSAIYTIEKALKEIEGDR